MARRRKRFLVEFPDGITDLIVAHPGGHIDLIEVDYGDDEITVLVPEDDEGSDAEDAIDPDEATGRPRRR